MEKKEETFLLVSLEEDKAKKLAQVISNDTCRKVLDYLAKKKATETELARELNMPLSTVHYNLKHLVDNRLVEAEEFHYSEKGREVLHYSLSNKYVIIAPKGVSESLRSKLKSIIGAIASVGFIALAMQYVPRLLYGTTKIAAVSKAAQPEAQIVTEGAPLLMREAAAEGAAAAPAQAAAPQLIPSENILIWILIGAVLCIAFYLLFEYIRKSYSKKTTKSDEVK